VVQRYLVLLKYRKDLVILECLADPEVQEPQRFLYHQVVLSYQ